MATEDGWGLQRHFSRIALDSVVEEPNARVISTEEQKLIINSDHTIRIQRTSATGEVAEIMQKPEGYDDWLSLMVTNPLAAMEKDDSSHKIFYWYISNEQTLKPHQEVRGTMYSPAGEGGMWVLESNEENDRRWDEVVRNTGSLEERVQKEGVVWNSERVNEILMQMMVEAGAVFHENWDEDAHNARLAVKNQEFINKVETKRQQLFEDGP